VYYYFIIIEYPTDYNIILWYFYVSSNFNYDIFFLKHIRVTLKMTGFQKYVCIVGYTLRNHLRKKQFITVTINILMLNQNII